MKLSQEMYWVGGVLLICAHVAFSAELLKVKHNATTVVIQISPQKPTAVGLLDLLDATSGRCVRTLHAGFFSTKHVISLKRAEIPPGSYRIRYREGISLTVDGHLALPGNEKWHNPADLFLKDNAIYVLDSGKAPSKKDAAKDVVSEDGLPPGESDEDKLFIYKFQRDGKPDASFGDRGRIGPLPHTPNHTRCLAVDAKNSIYINAGDYAITVLDAQGNKSRTIGGYDPERPVWVNSFAFGPSDRIYLANGCGPMHVCDRTKDKFAVLYTALQPNSGSGLNRCITADGTGAVYIIDGYGRLRKYVDTGEAIQPEYLSDPKLANPTGSHATAGLVWLACHGGAPFWDSDAGEVVLFWDNGATLTLVERFGEPGKSAEQLQFMNPSSVAQSPDGTELWVAEDGLTNDEGPPGNARVRRFRITASQTEELPLRNEKLSYP